MNRAEIKQTMAATAGLDANFREQLKQKLHQY